VLFWICCRFDDGEEVHNPPLKKFITNDFEVCYAVKLAVNVTEIKPTASYERFWGVVVKLLFWAVQRRSRAAWWPTIPEGAPTIDEDEPLTVVGIYRDALEKNGFKGLLDTVFHRTLPQ
jgi:hypothetical protein